MIQQIGLFVLALASFVRCEPPAPEYGAPYPASGGPNGPPLNSYGTPNYNEHGSDYDHSEPKSYEFGYQVKDDYTGTNYKRQETSDGNQVTGEYRVQLPDGRTQIVTYYADWKSGFHADVRYEGTAQYPENYNTGYNNNAQSYNAPGYNNGPGYNSGAGYPSGPSYPTGPGYNNAGYNYNNNNNNAYNPGSATSSVSIKDYSGPSTPYNTATQHNDYNNNNNNNNNNGYEYNAAEGYNYPSPGYGNKVRRNTDKDTKTP